MFLWNWTYILLVPAVLLAAYAQIKLRTTFRRYSGVAASRGLTGAEAAHRLLQANGIFDVAIGQATGLLSDHYDPRKRQLNLSPQVYSGKSLAAVGVAAHETGHAVQHARGYAPMALRSGLVPLTLGSNLAPILFFAGFFFRSPMMMNVAILLYSAAVLFTLVTLPVEFNASKRALAMLPESGIVTSAELPAVKAVLGAAALTYVAAALMALLQLLRFIILSRTSDD